MDYEVKPGMIISSSGVVEESVFERYDYPNRPGFYWFIKSTVPNRAEYVFYGSPNTKNSQGMAGRIIPFKCTDGQTINIQGPWWSNADAFKRSTGIDITDEYFTFIVISRERIHNYKRDFYTYIDVVYKDDGPTLGPYERYKKVLRDVFAVLPDEKLFLYHRCTSGGSHSLEQRSRWV